MLAIEGSMKERENSKLELGWAVAITAFLGLAMLIVDHFWGDYLVGHESRLHKAVSVCDFAKVERLLKEGADPNEYKRRPPLFFAESCQPPLKMQRLLLDAGADPNPVIDPGTSLEGRYLDLLMKPTWTDPDLIKLLESYLEKRANQRQKKTE